MATTFGDLSYPTVLDIPLRGKGQGSHILDKRDAKGHWWGLYVVRKPAGLFRGDPMTFRTEEERIKAEESFAEPETDTTIT